MRLVIRRRTYHAGMHTGTTWTATLGGETIGQYDAKDLSASWVDLGPIRGRMVCINKVTWRRAVVAEAERRLAAA